MSDAAEHQAGSLSSSVLRKKSIDTWKFASPFHSSRDKPGKGASLMVVEVSMHSAAGGQLEFVATGLGLKAPLTHTDINELKRAVESELRLQDTLRTNIKWDNWLEVCVSDERNSHAYRNGGSAGFRISYSRIARGLDAETGQAYTLGHNGNAMAFPLPKKSGERDADDKDPQWSTGRAVTDAYSYIPATAENIAALDDIMSKLNELRQRFATFLQQDAISEALDGFTSKFPALTFVTPSEGA